jgi:hypothetical protein
MEISQILPILIAFLILFVGLVVFLYYQISVKKELQIISPNGGEVLRAGESYTIEWKAKKIEKVDIVLVKEEEPKKSKIIVKDFPAKEKKYQWQIFAFEETSDRYKIAIFESPWKEGNKIDYSDGYFSIIGPKFVSCEQLTIAKNWPFIPNDYPKLKRVFLTKNEYRGNLGGLEGADKICQKEAEEMGLEGNWKAFLGDDNISALERLNLDGVFVFAEPEEGLPQEKIPAYFWESFGDYLERTLGKTDRFKKEIEPAFKTLSEYFEKFYQKWNLLQKNKSCYRFLAGNVQEFLKKLFSPYLAIKESPENEFFKSFFGQDIWLGRIYPEDKKNCIEIFSKYEEKSKNFSFTLTCQNWQSEQDYLKFEEKSTQIPYCYSPQGLRVEASGVAGASRVVLEEDDKRKIEISGRRCSESLKLLCVEQ